MKSLPNIENVYSGSIRKIINHFGNGVLKKCTYLTVNGNRLALPPRHRFTASTLL